MPVLIQRMIIDVFPATVLAVVIVTPWLIWKAIKEKKAEEKPVRSC